MKYDTQDKLKRDWHLKFVFSKKTTKIDEIFTVDLTFCTNKFSILGGFPGNCWFSVLPLFKKNLSNLKKINIWLFSYQFAFLLLLPNGYFDNRHCFEKIFPIQVRERPLMTSDIRVGKGQGGPRQPPKLDVIEQDKVGRSKMAKKRGTSLMDVP